MKIPPVEV